MHNLPDDIGNYTNDPRSPLYEEEEPEPEEEIDFDE